jgi:phage terminase large subunit-like protein
MPEYLASKDILDWPNGATTFLFSAERPENIRSVNLSYFWMDEAAFMDEVETAWLNAELATRIETPGNPIHILITSTPTGTPWVMKMEDDPDVEVRRVSTYANRINLSPDYLSKLEKEYEGTRTGRQELHGEVLRDVEGALWNDELFIHLRMKTAAEFFALLDSMDDRVLAVDPAGSKGPRSDAHGIIGVGVQHTDENDQPLNASRFYVVGDGTIKGSPSERSQQIFKVARFLRVNRIIVEKNANGEDVVQGLRDYAKLHPEEALDENGEEYQFVLEHAAQAKEVRAEPTVGKYEQGRVTHVTSPTPYGDLSALEKEQVGWVPKSRGGRMPSPNRIDALVWAVRALERAVKFAASVASSKDIMGKMRRTQIPNRLGARR